MRRLVAGFLRAFPAGSILIFALAPAPSVAAQERRSVCALELGAPDTAVRKAQDIYRFMNLAHPLQAAAIRDAKSIDELLVYLHWTDGFRFPAVDGFNRVKPSIWSFFDVGFSFDARDQLSYDGFGRFAIPFSRKINDYNILFTAIQDQYDRLIRSSEWASAFSPDDPIGPDKANNWSRLDESQRELVEYAIKGSKGFYTPSCTHLRLASRA